jgi:uncharacterized protein (TIGR01244 family)
MWNRKTTDAARAALLAAALLLTALSARAIQGPTEGSAAAETFGIKNTVQPEPGLLTAGQPTPEQLQEAAKAGYKTVLDLRAPGEDRGFDETKAAEAAGLAYVNVPVTPDTLDQAVIDRFLAALEGAERPVLVHCGTANRVGGVYYAYLVLEKGLSEQEALERARDAGLRSEELGEKVRRLVAERGEKKRM